MQDLDLTTFEEYVDVVGGNVPHALVLDWWRRIDLALGDYFQSPGKKRPSREEEERRIAEGPQLGPEVASTLSQLRRTRNAVAHEPTMLATADAAAYARTALWMIGKIALAFTRAARSQPPQANAHRFVPE
jgi:hypothetical protein